MKHIYHHSKKVLILALLMLFSISFYGQDAKTTFAPYWYLSGNIGTAFTDGDITEFSNFTNDLGFGFGFGIGRQISPVLGFNAQTHIYSLKGEHDTYASPALWKKSIDAGSPPCSPQIPIFRSGRAARPSSTAVSTSFPTPSLSSDWKGSALRMPDST